MANSSIMILNIVIFLLLISQGYSFCTLKNLTVTQVKTGVIVKNKPEWSVSVTNTCPPPCVQRSVILKCPGFQTVEPVLPSALVVSPMGTCLFNGGGPIAAHAVVSFKYAWDSALPLSPVSGLITCS
ncbi:TPD1 protein homolog 1B [Cajanus cajan]|uniref:TPD1 protein homolog 1B n=1 Tax=Cajanus cajan TaxID=3821 RepID=UPI00098DB6FD|nr:TPD1 protein homolog 1B [Cajanus cajan]